MFGNYIKTFNPSYFQNWVPYSCLAHLKKKLFNLKKFEKIVYFFQNLFKLVETLIWPGRIFNFSLLNYWHIAMCLKLESFGIFDDICGFSSAFEVKIYFIIDMEST